MKSRISSNVRTSHVISLFLLLVLPMLVFAAMQTQLFEKKAATSTDAYTTLTSQMVSLSQQYVQSSGTQKTTLQNQLVATATLRKKQLLNEIKTNPALFLSHVMPKSERSKLAPELVNLGLIEEEVTIEGTLTVLHFDDFTNNKSKEEYQVKTKSPTGRIKNSYNLYTAKGEIRSLTGSVVKVAGVSLDDNLAISDTTPAIFQQVSASSTPSTTGNKKIAVFLFNFTSNPQQPVSPQQLHNFLFVAPKSLTKFYQENSFNKLNFSGDVFGYYTLSGDHRTCDYRGWADEVKRIAVSKNVNLSAYTQFIYVPTTTCGVGGLAKTGGNEAWVNVWPLNYLYPFIHELGHLLGLSHASALDCNNLPIQYNYFRDPLYVCKHIEYGDKWDAMGSSTSINHFNAANKIWLNWFSSTQIKTITRQPTAYVNSLYVTLNPYETVSGVKAIKIPISTVTTVSPYLSYSYNYFIEYRTPLGFDANLPKRITDGVLIHLQVIASMPLFNIIESNPHLIDTAPDSLVSTSDVYKDFTDASLVDGSSFYDPFNKIYIKQTRHDANSVTVFIDLGPGANATPPPQGPYNPPPSPTTPQTSM